MAIPRWNSAHSAQKKAYLTPQDLPELLALRNVVLTPHIGSASLATRTAMVRLAVDNLLAGLGLDGTPSNMPSAINADAAIAARVALGKKGGKR